MVSFMLWSVYTQPRYHGTLSSRLDVMGGGSCPSGNRTLCHPAHILVTILTMLSWVCFENAYNYDIC